MGVVAGKWAQNGLTAIKVLGITGLVIAGVWVAAAHVTAPSSDRETGPERPAEVTTDSGPEANIGLALVFVLYAFGGWAHAAYVAAEVRDQPRNLPRALVLGITGITAIYLAVNISYVAALGFDGARATLTPATDVLEIACGPWGGRAISLLVMLSALGAINGMILTASRIYAVWGSDYPAIGWLGAWNRRTAVPVTAITVQAAIAVLLIALVGTAVGRNLFDGALVCVALPAFRWGDFLGGFEMLVAGFAPVFWGLCLLTGLAVFVLRKKDRAVERPFRVPLFPWPPLVFCGTCLYMLWASLAYAKWLTLIGVAPLAVGGLLGLVALKRSALRQ
jgi:amino acid transporter